MSGPVAVIEREIQEEKFEHWKIGNLKNGNFQIGNEVILKWNGPSGPP